MKPKQPIILWIALALFCMTGCGPNMRPYGVPFGGSLVGEAAGKAASFTSPRDGTAWVAGPGHPGQERYIVYSGWIKAGQTITVDPQAHSVTMNGEQQKASVEGGNSYYQIWYQPSQD